MIARLFFFLLLATYTSSCYAYGPPDYAPDGAHPRVWIDSTKLSELVAKKNANTAEWAALKSWGDANIATNISESYQGLAWMGAALNYSLLYRVSGDEAYATRAVVYLNAMLNDCVRSGSIGNQTCATTERGDLAISVDSGYVARSIGTGVAVARDWLDGSLALTPEIVSLVNSRLGAWITWYAANGFSRTSPYDNYYAGYFAMVFTAAIACYGDTNYQESWLTQAKTMWNSEVLPLINGYLAGGDWAEGWNYGPWSAREFLQFPLAMETGVGNSNYWAETTWHEDLIKSHMHMLHPSKVKMSDYGTWSGSPSAKGNPRSGPTMDFLASASPSLSSLKEMARWYSKFVASDSGTLWENFLWKDSTYSGTAPSLAALGSLSYLMGNGHGISRSDDWENTNATWVEMLAPGGGPDGAAQQDGDMCVGEIKISSRGKRLLVDGNSYSLASRYGSVPQVTGSHTYAPDQDVWYDRNYPTINSPVLNMNSGNGYTFFRGVGLEAAYDGRRYATTGSLTKYNRSALFILPDIVVVYDNYDVIDPAVNTFKNRFYFEGIPALSGSVATLTSGSAKIAMTTIDGTLVSPVKTETDLTNSYRVDITYPSGDAGQVTVFETMASDVSAATVAPISGTGGKGCLIGGSKAVIFSDNHSQMLISDLSYITSATTHYIADLPLSSNVEVFRGGVSLGTFNTGSAGIITFSSAAGEATYTIGDPIVVEPSCETDATLCTTESACTAAWPTYYFCSGVCQSAACPVSRALSPTLYRSGSNQLGVAQ